MWSGSYNKTNIEEANKHLQALTEKVLDLTKKVKEQEESLQQREFEMQAIVQDVATKSQNEVALLEDKLQKSEHKIRRFESIMEEKDTELNQLRQKCRMLDDLVKYKSTLAKLTITLEQAENYANQSMKRNYSNDPHQRSLPNGNGLTLAERAGKSLEYTPTDKELYL